MASRASRYLPAPPASLERRAALRWPVVVSDAAGVGAGPPCPAVLSEVSAYGCRIELSGAARAGDRLWLRLADGPAVAATVVWSADGLAGCRFDVALPRAALRALTVPG